MRPRLKRRLAIAAARAGKSLAQVATAQGRTVDGLEQAIRSAVAAQRSARLDLIVNRTVVGR